MVLNRSIVSCLSIQCDAFNSVILWCVCVFVAVVLRSSLVNCESFETETNLIQCKTESRFSIAPEHIHTHTFAHVGDSAGRFYEIHTLPHPPVTKSGVANMTVTVSHKII